MDDFDYLDEVYQGAGGFNMPSFDLADAFNFGDLSGITNQIDLADAFNFGDLSGIISGIDYGELFGDLSDISGGIEGFGDIADIVGQGAAGITGIEGFGAAADEVGQGAMGIQGIEGFGQAADEVGQGAAGITGISGFGEAADQVGQGATTTTPDGSRGTKTPPPPGPGPGPGPGPKSPPGPSIPDWLKGLLPSKDNAMLYALLGGLMGLLNRGSGTKLPVGYQGSIPKYTAVRGKAESPRAGGRRPGGAGIGSLAGTTKYIPAAAGGLMGLAGGGRPARYLRGGTDGMADKIKTDIDGKQPARLSHGEFVIPADVVSHLGNGNSDAGADVLYDMMAKVRKARTGNSKQGKQINPRKYTPA